MIPGRMDLPRKGPLFENANLPVPTGNTSVGSKWEGTGSVGLARTKRATPPCQTRRETSLADQVGLGRPQPDRFGDRMLREGRSDSRQGAILVELRIPSLQGIGLYNN